MVITRSGQDTTMINQSSFTEKDWSSVFPTRQGFLPYFPSDREFAISVLKIARKRNPYSRILSERHLNNLSDTDLIKYLHEKVSFDSFD
jgi:hypothetical protein